MKKYYETEIDEGFNISKIVTVFWKDFSLEGEAYFKKGKAGEKHDFWELLFIAGGSHRVKVENTVFSLNEGEVMFYAPNQWHGGIAGYRPGAKVGIISFVSNCVYLNDFKNRKFKLDTVLRSYIKEAITLGSETFESINNDPEYKGMRIKRNADSTKLMRIKLLMEELLSEIYIKYCKNETTLKSKGNETVCRLVCHMEENIERALTVEDLAAIVNLSPSRVKAIFKEHKGCGIIDYFIDLKLQKAAELIKNNQDTITQISDRLGFSSVSYFSRLFKRRMGIAPLEYRKL
jgi:AraC-like DNA-binding protein